MSHDDAAAKAVAQISKNTLAVHGRKQEQNAILNIPAMAKSHGVEALRWIFKDLPIVVAGAGPSLDKAIPILKQYAGQYCLIAVDRALKPLLDAGIIPHVVTSTDMDVTVAPLFSGYRIPHTIALLYDRDGYWQLPKNWPGPLITYDTFFDVPIWESTFLGFKGTLCKNFTVSHTAYYLAAQMGGAPIILTGVDFAYPSADDHHVKGAVEIPNEVHEKKVAHWVDVPGNTLEQVHTTEVFSICVVAFESAIKESKAKVFNVSEVGAKIQGAAYEPLEKVLADHCKGQRNFQETLDSAYAEDKPQFDLEAFDEQSKHMFQSLKALVEQCEEGLEILGRLKKININNKLDRPKWNRVYQRVLSIRMEMMDNAFLQYILQRMMVRGTNEIEKMLEPIMLLKNDDPIRLIQENAASVVLFWQEMECANLFMNALWNVRKELGLDITDCGPGVEGIPESLVVRE
jgi:hypothetical protein